MEIALGQVENSVRGFFFGAGCIRFGPESIENQDIIVFLNISTSLKMSCDHVQKYQYCLLLIL